MGLSILKNKGEKVFNWLKKPNYILIIAWVLPIGILLTILYLNFLPFGYNKTLTIDVGTSGDDKGQFYLDTSRADLGSRQELDGKTFRYLDGLAYAVYKPKVVLNNASLEASLEGEGVSFILPPDLSDVNWDYDWNLEKMSQVFEVKTKEEDLYKRFTNSLTVEIATSTNIKPDKEMAIEADWRADRKSEVLGGDITVSHNQKTLTLKYQNIQIDYKLPDLFLGKKHNILVAFEGKNIYLFVDGVSAGKKTLIQDISQSNSLNISKAANTETLKLRPEIKAQINSKDNCAYFDGKTKLEMTSSSEMFEDDAFTISTEWIPEVATNSQQIIGHFNWEIWQNEKTVSFQVGRMNDKDGKFYKVNYQVTDDKFFNKKHSLIATYNPISDNNSNGYIELFVDGAFAGKEYFANEIIWKDYGSNNLTLGWTIHSYSKYPYFEGSICQIKLTKTTKQAQTAKTWNFNSSQDIIKMPLYGSGEIKKLELEIKQR